MSQLSLGISDEQCGGATLSPQGIYRYDLWRRWGDQADWVLWIMLNPSIADASLDDPTIRRCRGFSVAWGHDGLAVVNLFALRATDPRALTKDKDPAGPLNAQTIKTWLADPRISRVVAAWGMAWEKVDQPRLNVELFAQRAGHDVHCLGMTKAGHPRHPLYVPADQPLVIFREAAA